MSEMEPVAWFGAGKLFQDRLFIDRQQAQNWLEERDGHGTGREVIPLVRLSDAEDRIRELSKWRDEWKDMATEFKGLVEEWRARAEAAEARLKEAGEALEPFLKLDEGFIGQRTDNDVVQVTWTPDGPHKITFGHLRAARSIASKIGGKDE